MIEEKEEFAMRRSLFVHILIREQNVFYTSNIGVVDLIAFKHHVLMKPAAAEFCQICPMHIFGLDPHFFSELGDFSDSLVRFFLAFLGNVQEELLRGTPSCF